MTLCTDWIGSLSRRLTARADGARDQGTDKSPFYVVRQQLPDSAAVVDGTRRTLAHVLERVQNWLSGDSHDDDARLVVLTRGAIAVDSSEDVTDLGQAAVWGLLRSAQSENPGRISLVDVDDWANAEVAIAETASRDESQLAVRDGVCFAPRLAPQPSESRALNLSRSAHGGLPPSATAHSTRGTLLCARGPNPSEPWSPARYVWVCAAPV